MIIYKDILGKLKEAGYTTTRLRNEKLLSEYTLTSFRQGRHVSTESLDLVCKLTGLDIADLIEYIKD